MALLWSLGTFSQTAVVVLLLCCVDANFLCMLGVCMLALSLLPMRVGRVKFTQTEVRRK